MKVTVNADGVTEYDCTPQEWAYVQEHKQMVAEEEQRQREADAAPSAVEKPEPIQVVIPTPPLPVALTQDQIDERAQILSSLSRRQCEAYLVLDKHRERGISREALGKELGITPDAAGGRLTALRHMGVSVKRVRRGVWRLT